VKHVNTRFPDDLYEAAAAAANNDRRPLGAWVRIAVEEKLARDHAEKLLNARNQFATGMRNAAIPVEDGMHQASEALTLRVLGNW
jgi:hypothetical protein